MASTRVKKSSRGYNYKYTDLAAIHEELEAQGITYRQEIRFNVKAGADYIWTILTEDGKSTEPICGCRLVMGGLKGGNPAQEQGSAITYARRYSLLMALGWACEDDDAASVTSQPVQRSAYGGYNQSTPQGGGSRLDFDKLKGRLVELNSTAEVEDAKTKTLAAYPNMSPKQRGAVEGIFAARLHELREGVEL